VPETRTPAKHLASRLNYLKLPLLLLAVVVMLAIGGGALAFKARDTYHGAKSVLVGSGKPPRMLTLEASPTPTSKPLACPAPPVGKTDYQLLYNSRGNAYVNGRRVLADEGQDWTTSYFPKPGPPQTAMYQWTISPYWEIHVKGGGAWAVITNGHECALKTLVSTESDVVYDVDGVQVAATNLSLAVPTGYRLGKVVIALNSKDPREAN
jgi:hypothetical protein